MIDKLTKINHSKRNVTSACLIVIAAFAMYKWTVMPHFATLSSTKAYGSAIENLTTESKEIAQKVEVRRSKLKELREQSTQLMSLLFTSDQGNEFFSDLEVISEQTGCTVHSINLIAGDNTKIEHLGVRTRSAELIVAGSYDNITKLIRRLQGRSQKVWIDTLTLQAVEQNSNKVGCTLTLTICETLDKDTL
jgi:hypothetical protein